MASREEDRFASEWEYDEVNKEESGIQSAEGEEAGRVLTKNEKAWNSCEKGKADVNYHQRYIPLKDALRFRDLSTEENETFVKDKGITNEDKMFLSSEKAAKCLEKLSGAVVCITVKQSTAQSYGTGFFVHVNNEDAIITNSHNIRSTTSGKGIDFRLVKPDDLRVAFFYNGMGAKQVTYEVTRIERASPPDKNKDKNVLMDIMKGELLGDGTKDTPQIRKCNVALGLLSSYFNTMDAFLDYAFLYLKPLGNEEQKHKFANVKPLEMKPFKILQNFRNVSTIGIPDPMSSEYPRFLRLFSISHPHRASQQLSFGGLESDLFHVYNLNMVYGQNDTERLHGKEPFAEHSIVTCKGSSGAPIFFYIFNHDTGEVDVDEAVYFLHFYGERDGKLHGKAVSFSTIIKNLPVQAIHENLAVAFAKVREYKKESTSA